MFENLRALWSRLRDLTWGPEPILWLGGVVAALNVFYGIVSSDTVSIGEAWESLAILGAAVLGRSRVSPTLPA